MYSKTIIMGRLTVEPELKYTPSGDAVCTIRVAANRWKPSPSGQTADFFSITLWKQNAEYAANYCHKGDLVFAEGTPQNREWVAQDGSKRTTFELSAQQFKKLASPQGAGNSADPPAGAADVGLGDDADFNDPFADQ